MNSKRLFFLFALIFLSKAHEEGFQCGHTLDDQPPEFLDVEENTPETPEGRTLQSEDYPNLRIYGIYDFLEDTAPSSYTEYIREELAPPVFDYFGPALRVKSPVSGKLKLGSVSSVCSKKTPSILKDSGVDADFVMIFDSRSEDSTVVASSRYCFLSSGSKRPLVGQTNFNRQMLKEAKGDILLHEKNMYLLIHEMMHIFGVSDNVFKYYLDENGNTRKNHIKSVSVAGKTRTVIDIPELTDKLRKFYGCSSIPGLIMENDGGSGTAGSHLERKFFVYETMSSGGIFGRRVSEFSLGLLEGSGWYAPDYKYAEPYFFGQGQGCGFVSNKCSSSSSQFEEFCTGSSRGCAPHGRSGGKCGSDSKADGCKYVDPDQDNDCDNDDGYDDARLSQLEVYGRGAGSKCFTGDLNTRKSSSGKTSFCFKYNCVGEGQDIQLEVLLGKDKVVCASEGKRSVDGYYGAIDCPDPLKFCNTVGKKYCPRGCMGRGTCIDNKCQCDSGFRGVDCGLKD